MNITQTKKPLLTKALLKITPKHIHHIKILPENSISWKGSAICRVFKNSNDKLFIIHTPSPLKSIENLLIFLHECAHITLGHTNAPLH